MRALSVDLSATSRSAGLATNQMRLEESGESQGQRFITQSLEIEQHPPPVRIKH